MKDNRLITLSFRKIKKSLKRYFSLIILSLLGTGFFIGMKVSMPNLLVSLDDYYKEKAVYDIEILSTNGLNQEDIKALDKLDESFKVYGLHSKDALFNDKNLDSSVIRIKELNSNVNNILLLKGRMPKNKYEILIDEKYLLSKNAKVGDTLELALDKDDKDLNVKELKIVGIINSPLYLATDKGSLNRGNTLLGNGEVKYYAYALKNIFNTDYYTEIYISTDKVNIDLTNSEEYNEKVNEAIKKINKIKDERIKYRYEELRNIALKRIEKEEEKVNIEITNSKLKLDEVKIGLDIANNEITSKKKELDYAYRELQNKQNEINTMDATIINAESELERNKKLLDENKNKIDNYDQYLAIAIRNKNHQLTKSDLLFLIANENNYQDTKEKLDIAENAGVNLSNIGIIKEQIKNYGIDPDGSLIANLNELEENLNHILELDNGYKLYNNKILEIRNYKSQLETAKTVYDSYSKEYNYGNKKYQELLQEYNENLNKYNEALIELTEKEMVAKQEFEKARIEIDKSIVPGTWLIKNRLDNIDYSGFIDSIESLKRIAFIFPIIFFIVSIFISLLSMARMGIEDRKEMGTLKAFGFSKIEILMPYIIYSLSATLIGSIIGVFIGIFVFPTIVFNVYANLYALPKMIYGNITFVLISGVLISVLCIVGSTIISIANILKEETVSLLRPIAPPIGKKILLEKIPAIWNKITFENKVTLRNIFRYKRRVVMTLTGIVSCTMILISAFLIRDSITTVLDKQFNVLFTYNSMVYLDGTKLTYELDEIFNDKHIKDIMYANLERVKVNNNSVNLLVPNKKEELKGFFNLINNNKKLELTDNSVIITSKLARLLKLNKNDYITIKTTNNKEYKLKVSDITENHIGNYIYMSKKYYQEEIGLHKINIAYLKLDNPANEHNLVTKLLEKNTNILSYLSINNSIAMVKNMFTSLNSVVLIVVIFSLLLSIVVLYSLAYIIISERQREIATLKVLGFDDEEVDMYLLKEQAIIIIIGIILGLIVGIIYSLILVDTLEISMVEFNKELLFRNFLVCIILMLVFANIVGQLIHFRLRKIDMIDSLKSIE